MLKIDNVSKTFNLTGNAEDNRIALDNVSLEIKEGEFVTIIGGNGSGKSTLMNIISGVLSPDEGRVLIDGEDVTKLKEWKRAKYLGRVFQDPMVGTTAEMSVLENLELANKRGEKHTLKWGFKKSKKAFYSRELEKFGLGLEKRMTQKVGMLSGGQRQALTLLMATLKRPKILLLDEHTAALDPKTSKRVLQITDQIVRENKLTTMMITHNMKDAIKYGDRLIMLNNGHIVMDISGEEKAKLKARDLIDMFEDSGTLPIKKVEKAPEEAKTDANEKSIDIDRKAFKEIVQEEIKKAFGAFTNK